MADLEPVIFSGITVIPLIHDPVILNGITRSHSAGLAGHFERDYAIPSIGGFVATKEKFCTLFQSQANPCIFQTCIPPADAAAILASLEVMT